MFPWLDKAVEVVFPPLCVSCKGDRPSGDKRPLCRRCVFEIRPMGRVNRHKGNSIETLYSACRFEGPVRDLIHSYKYRGQDYLADYLADLCFRYWPRLVNIDAFIPVPMSFWREITRGFNHTNLLARKCGALFNVRFVPSCLTRKTGPPSQTRLTKRARIKNAAAAYTVGSVPKELKGKSVMLIDDVCTTGATLDVCADILKKAGVRTVFAGTVAYDEQKLS